MWKLYGSKNRKQQKGKNNKDHPQKQRHILRICFVIAGVLLVFAGAWVIISYFREDAAADDEYDQLREMFYDHVEDEPVPVIDNDEEDIYVDYGYGDYGDEEEEDDEEEDDGIDLLSLSLAELARLNSDFIGWISIRGHIELPVVRGSDNTKYMNTTFTGQRNTAGAIFMDYRVTDNFDAKAGILHGHHSRNNRMFAPLMNYLNPSFLQRNPTIRITTSDGRELTYTVFHAKLTDAWDSAYSTVIYNSGRAAEYFPNAPADANRFLLLSTCTRRGDEDERLLVFAASYD